LTQFQPNCWIPSFILQGVSLEDFLQPVEERSYRGQKRALAIDPGLRTGCKMAVLDAQGQLVFHAGRLQLFLTGRNLSDHLFR